jgi:hypothetical protein
MSFLILRSVEFRKKTRSCATDSQEDEMGTIDFVFIL